VKELARAIFLDRDGTILKEVTGQPPEPEAYGYLIKEEQVELIEGSASAIALAKGLGFKIIVITNQSAVARGYLTEDDLSRIHNRMNQLLLACDSNAIIDDIFYCPYFSGGVVERYSKEDNCRKPATGMIMKAKERYNLDLTNSYMIGDYITDMQCGANAGLKNILVLTGYGKRTYSKCLDEKLNIEFIANNLFDAVKYIQTNYTL
jgi:D-glycero-D-manno-heptose 1,7-bisphosphate phosphatase